MTALIRPRSALILLFAAVAALSLFAVAGPVRAGEPMPPCSMLAYSDSSPVPSSPATVRTSEIVNVAGAGFTPNAVVQIRMLREGAFANPATANTDSTGSFLFTWFFFQSLGGNWTFEATDPGGCVASIDLTVTARPTACPLVGYTDSSPTPSTFKVVTVGQVVHVTGTGFIPGATVQVDVYRNDVLQETLPELADETGSFRVDIGFPVPTDIAVWTITGRETGGCSSSMYVTVQPAGPVGRVVVGTLLCPPDLQTRAAVEAAGVEACSEVVVLPEDNVVLPPGFTSNLRALDYAYGLTSTDAFTWTLPDAELHGGGFCDPVAMACRFGFAYRWSYVASGLASLQLVTSPAGYRFGFALIGGVDGVDPLTTDPTTGTVTFVVPEGDLDVAVFLFAGEAPVDCEKPKDKKHKPDYCKDKVKDEDPPTLG